MRQETVMNDPFQNFRDEVQIGNWTIAGEVILWQRVLFESWKDKRMLEVHRNCGFLETEIGEQVESLDDRIIILTSSGVAGVKLIKGGGESGEGM